MARKLVAERTERGRPAHRGEPHLVSATEQLLNDADSGRRQREAGERSGGRTRQATREALRAAVTAIHKKRPDRTFTDACREVTKKHGYTSEKQATAAAADIKWPDPRRKGATRLPK